MGTGEENGKVTLAVLGTKMDLLSTDVKDVKQAVGDLHESSTRQDELTKAMKHQLWKPDGTSRIQCAEETANSAKTLAVIVLVPIGLAVISAMLLILFK